MAEKLSRQTGHWRAGDDGLLGWLERLCEAMVEAMEEAMVEAVLEAVEDGGGEAVRSMVISSSSPGDLDWTDWDRPGNTNGPF